MKVLFLCSEYIHPTQPLGGVFFMEQAHALRDAGVQVDIAFVEPRSLRTLSLHAFVKQHFQVVSSVENGIFTLRQLGWNPFISIGIGGKLYSLLTFHLAKKYIKYYGKPDLIHAHCALWVGPAASKLSDLYNIPYIITEHNSSVLTHQGPIAERALRITYDKADRIVSVSHYLAKAMKRRTNQKIFDIIPNMVDTDYFQPSSIPSLAISDGPRIVAIGNLDENKSHDVLLRAFAKLCIKIPQSKLTIAGDGPRYDELQQLAAKLNVSVNVKFVGLISRDGVRDLLRNADMLVQASKFETFGVVLIEAGAVGIPVIATTCGGPNEIVTPATGMLVPVDDVEAIALAMHDTWFKSWDSMAIRREIVKVYGRVSVVKQLIKLYGSVVRK
jgi:glycosyltransferase involved in cell wall biosynthesis